MGKKALRFGVSEALLVSAMGAVSAGCFLFEQTEVTSNPGPDMRDCATDPGPGCATVNPAPDLGNCDNDPNGWGCPPLNPGPGDMPDMFDMSVDMSDMCPDEPVECGLNDPSCPCYTVNPGPDLPDMVDDASMDDMSGDMSEDMDSDQGEDMEGDMVEDMDVDMSEDMSGDM